MLGIDVLDWIVLTLYMVGIASIGLFTYKKVKATADYFIGSRKFGKLLMVAQAFGSGTHTDQPVSVAGATYQIGLAGIWYQWIWMFATPFYWLLAPVYRRMRYITIGDFFEQRYGKSLGALYGVFGLVFFMVNIGTMLKGTGTTIAAITNGALSIEMSVLSMGALVILYGIAGGLVAAAVTDFIQGMFIIVLSFLLIPFAFNVIGGFRELHASLPENMFSFVAPVEVTLFFIIMAVINGLIGIVVQPHHMAVTSAGKSEHDCRVGYTYGNFVKRITTVGWAYVGILAAVLYPNLEHRELAFGVAVTNLLPAGLIGLMLASMMAAAMSTCDTFMVSASALFTRNFYQVYFKQLSRRTDLLFIARVASAIVIIGGVVFAYYIPNVIFGMKVIWKITAYLGISFWFGVIWKNANRYGAWASFLVASIISVVVGDTFSWGLGWDFKYESALYLPAGFLAMIVVSKLTKPEPAEQLNKFYALLDTPVGEEERLKKQGVEMILEGDEITSNREYIRTGISQTEKGHSLLIVNLLKLIKNFGYKKYKVDLIGFVLAWMIVFLIIAVTVWFAGIGA
ncbi:MAG: sodium:solute symporter [bacterium]